MIRIILRLEGISFFLIALYFYQFFHGSWLLFVLLLFIPDISMIGYLKNKNVGALIYNLMHNYVLALFVICIGFLFLKDNTITIIGIILFAHVALDRFLGYGLKYPTNFKDTHLQRL